MTEEITPELFSHLVDLAALELSVEESRYLREQMNNQLKSIHELAAIPINEEIHIASHGIEFSREISAQTRSDNCLPFSNPDKLLSQAPEVDDGYIIVPEIPHKDLD